MSCSSRFLLSNCSGESLPFFFCWAISLFSCMNQPFVVVTLLKLRDIAKDEEIFAEYILPEGIQLVTTESAAQL